MFEENNNKKGPINKALIFAIVGVTLLVVAVAGSAYAYYSATVQNTSTVTGNAGGGAAPTLTVTKLSTSATGNLIPIDANADTLTKGALGWDSTNKKMNTAWNATYACKDKNAYSVCQIYSVTLKNNSSNTMKFNIGVTALTGTNTPNIDVVKMASNISVTTVTSIKGSTTGIASAVSLNSGATTSTYYIMVFIKNLSSAQTDNGSFKGTITATSTTGAQVKATFA